MIISLTIENWMSFRDPIKFSMITTRERQHNERLSKVKKYRNSFLPIAALYGGNASGKSNLCKALEFAKNFVTKGTPIERKISVIPFKLDAQQEIKPVRFTFMILINDTLFEFEFSATQERVIKEKLIKITGKSEETLYSYDKRDKKHKLAGSLTENKNEKDNRFVDFLYKGTPKNQLFLTNAIRQNIDIIKGKSRHLYDVYNWFKDNLVVIDPNTSYMYGNKDNDFYNSISKILQELDTGIEEIKMSKIPFENIAGIIPNELSNMMIDNIKDEDENKRIIINPQDRIAITKQKGDLITQKLSTYHRSWDGAQLIKFSFKEESDGSKRIIDLIPAFLNLCEPDSRKVVIIDEIDRSLHPLLTQQLIESYLKSRSPESRSQLVFTTHNALLMTQKLFRRDEIWVMERNDRGVSKLFSFSDFKDTRYDKDIRKSYLQGRMGGIPKILFNSSFCNNSD